MRFSTVALLGLLSVAACEKRPSDWKGWVYPNKDDLTYDLPLGSFADLESCRASALGVIEALPGGTVADYECGFRCRQDGGLGGLNICEKTER